MQRGSFFAHTFDHAEKDGAEPNSINIFVPSLTNLGKLTWEIE